MTNYYLECACCSNEHLVKLIYDDGTHDIPFLAMYVQLIQEPWYKRIWKGIKYIFGHQCVYGHWDEFIFDEKTALKFKFLLTRYINDGLVEVKEYLPSNFGPKTGFE